MALSIPHSFVNNSVAEASEVNGNFTAVKQFVDALQDGTGIDSNAITGAKIATSAVTETKIAGLSVTSGKIADGAVTTTKLAAGAASAGFNSAQNAQTGTTYTLVLSDLGKLVELNNDAGITLSVPTNSSVAFAVGDRIDLLQTGAGQVTVVGAVGVTLNSEGSKTKLAGQWAAATLIKRATDTWVLIGNIAA
jgi:hypothetical protein